MNGIININQSGKKAYDWRLWTLDPTGFFYGNNITVSYSQVTRKITLTAAVNEDLRALYHGALVPGLESGVTTWESSAHAENPTTTLFLKYNGNGFEWSTSVWNFHEMQIAYVCYKSNGTFCFAQRETHNLMPWTVHRHFHKYFGTVRDSGGDISGYTPGSTTLKQPDFSACTIDDEDLTTIIPALTSKVYAQFYLSGAGASGNIAVDQTHIVPVSTNQPYYNQYTGGAWQQTLMSNNNYMSIWVIAFPTTADTDSQKKRFMWMQGQSQGTLAEQRALSPLNLTLGELSSISSEFVFIEQIIIQYTGGNWSITESRKITGNKQSQTSAPSGNYLSSVSTDATLTGNGTTSSPLSGHAKQHAITSASDHTSSATSGQILKADANGLPVNATNTDAQVSAAVTASHAKQHSLQSTSDHTSSATSGQILKADANGLPVNATNTDAQVSAAVTASHARQHSLQSTLDHTSTLTAGTIPKGDANGLPVNSIITELGTEITIGGAAIIGEDGVATNSEISIRPRVNKYLGETTDSAVNYILLCRTLTSAGTFTATGFDGIIDLYRGKTTFYNNAIKIEVSAKNACNDVIINKFNVSIGKAETPADIDLVTVDYNSVNYLAVRISTLSAHATFYSGRYWGTAPSIVSGAEVTNIVVSREANIGITSLGKVGFGTIAPTEVVDVAGNINLSGVIKIGTVDKSTDWTAAKTHADNTTTAVHGATTVGYGVFKAASAEAARDTLEVPTIKNKISETITLTNSSTSGYFDITIPTRTDNTTLDRPSGKITLLMENSNGGDFTAKRIDRYDIIWVKSAASPYLKITSTTTTDSLQTANVGLTFSIVEGKIRVTASATSGGTWSISVRIKGQIVESTDFEL